MIQRILVPIAFSPYSKGLLDYASTLAQITGAELVVVNVIHSRDLDAVSKITSYGYQLNVEEYVNTIKKERREGLKKLLKDLPLAEEKVSHTFCIGDPASKLIQLVLDRKVDTVVMGVKTKDIRHIFTGSVAEQMFRKCPVNLISVREDEIRERLAKKFLRHQTSKGERTVDQG